MKLHPLLLNPNAVLVYQAPVPENVAWDDFRRVAFQALQVMHLELEGEKVLIKPNVTSGEHFANPDLGIDTHPGFVQGMIDFAREQGTPTRRITIIEDPRDSDDNHPRHWRGTGYDRLSQETGVRLHCPTTYTCVKVAVPQPLVFPRLNVSRLAVAPNTLLINVPKLKTHNLAITTLCLKNLMGLVNVFDRHYCNQAWQELPEEISMNPRPRNEWLTHQDHEKWQHGLARRLADTAQVFALPLRGLPMLNLVEGVVGREGTGFQRGRNRSLGMAIAGLNPVAVDSVASYLMGFDPQRLIYLQVAADAGLGPTDLGKIDVYTAPEGEIVPCPDVEALRIRPVMHVISNIKEEDPDSEKLITPIVGDKSADAAFYMKPKESGPGRTEH
jgi:uncharacterized protein (DUF362 family)